MNISALPGTAVAIAALVALAGCAADRSASAYDRGSMLAVAASGVNPSEELREGWARELLFLPIVAGPGQEPYHGLSRMTQHSADGREWTLRLRTDVRWEDGVPVTAGDVKFALDVLQHPAVNQAAPVEVETPDDSTVILRAERPLTAQELAWHTALPAHLLREQDPAQFADWEFWKAPIGNGPYRLVRVLPATAAEFARSATWAGPRPRVERFLLRFGTGASLTDLLAGQVDMMSIMTPADALKVSADPRFRLSPLYWPTMQVSVLWRNDHPLFSDPRVRRALTMAIDRRTLLQVLGLPASAPISDAIHTPGQLRAGELPEPVPYDPAAARALLAEAGWEDRDGDGLLDRDGKPFRFALLAPNMGFGTQQTGVFLQDQLKRIGIDAQIQPLEYTLVLQRLRSHEYEAVLERNFLQPSALHRMFGGDGENTLRYRDAEFSALAERVRTAVAAEDEAAAYARMTEIFRRDLPVTPLFPLTGMMAVHRRVGGLGEVRWSDSAWRLADLWVEEERTP